MTRRFARADIADWIAAALVLVALGAFVIWWPL